MIKDDYTDIRIVERILYENTLYMLNSINHKVDSFTVNKTTQTRHREKA